MARESKRQRAARERQETRASLAFYFAMILVAGQFIGNEVFGVPVNYLLLMLSAFIIVGVLFGPIVAIEFLRAIRGSNADDRRPPAPGGDDADD